MQYLKYNFCNLNYGYSCICQKLFEQEGLLYQPFQGSHALEILCSVLLAEENIIS